MWEGEGEREGTTMVNTAFMDRGKIAEGDFRRVMR